MAEDALGYCIDGGYLVLVKFPPNVFDDGVLAGRAGGRGVRGEDGEGDVAGPVRQDLLLGLGLSVLCSLICSQNYAPDLEGLCTAKPRHCETAVSQ